MKFEYGGRFDMYDVISQNPRRSKAVQGWEGNIMADPFGQPDDRVREIIKKELNCKKNKSCRALFFIAFFSGCASAPNPQLSVPEYPRELDRMEEGRLFEIPMSGDGRAKEILAGREFVEITGHELRLLDAPSFFLSQKHVYLVRSIRDDGSGKYSAFFRDGHLILLYTNFGSCGIRSTGAVLVATQSVLKTMSSDCSGIL